MNEQNFFGLLYNLNVSLDEMQQSLHVKLQTFFYVPDLNNYVAFSAKIILIAD